MIYSRDQESYGAALAADQSVAGSPSVGDLTIEELPASKLFLAAIARFREAHGVLECWLRGGSMGRAIPAGSHIRIAFVDPLSCHTGQVIAFLTEGRICVHRVVYRGRSGTARNTLITRGDRCLLPDFPVDVESVLGPVIEFSLEEGIWTSPGGPERRNPAVRALSFMADKLFAALIEIDATSAKWLLTKLRCAVRAMRAMARATLRGFG